LVLVLMLVRVAVIEAIVTKRSAHAVAAASTVALVGGDGGCNGGGINGGSGEGGGGESGGGEGDGSEGGGGEGGGGEGGGSMGGRKIFRARVNGYTVGAKSTNLILWSIP